MNSYKKILENIRNASENIAEYSMGKACKEEIDVLVKSSYYHWFAFSDHRSEINAVSHTVSPPDRVKRTTRPIAPYSPRFVPSFPSFNYQAVVYRVEIEKCVSLHSVQKRREADDNFKFTEYVVTEIIPLFSIF